jgi:Chitobiase/beta-hexosaminidase C-terminal domain/Fibronectin type III domain
LFLSSLSTPSPRRRRLNRRLALGLVAGAAVAAGTGGAIVATAAVPSFPDNIVVFPDRDFISVEGYQNHVGETALVELTRAGKVIGSAKGVVEAGDVAFEINHPGGYCWGNGTDLQVTPDIRPGDKATISFNGIEAGDTTVSSAMVTGDATVDGNTLTVKGTIGPDVNPAQIEQRIINADLVDTEIGRRDIRAVPGPLTPAPKGGYSSALAVDAAGTFTATYIFDNPDTAAIAAASDLGERAMSWQVEDADGNRQGLTIAEYGELGGPGMGGCPAGPGDQAAPAPGTASVVRSTDKTSVSVTWEKATPVPGAADVTGYSVEAIQQTPSATGERIQLGKRTGAAATHVNIDGLTANQGYDVEVRALTGAKMSEAFTVQVPTVQGAADRTPPVLTATPGSKTTVNVTSSVTLSSEAGADIYYTINGTAVVKAGLPSDTALHYTGPIAISQAVTLNAVAFDRAGNAGTFTAQYKPPADTSPVPSPITNITGTAGQQSVTLSWASTETGVTGFAVQTFLDGVKSGALIETPNKTLTINNLVAGGNYTFTVQARNAAGLSDPSTPYGPLVPTKITDRVTITSARWKSGDFRVVGTGSQVGAFVTIYGQTAGKIDHEKKYGTQQVVAAAAPATGGDYDFRLRNGAAPASNPGNIYVESDGGGVAGPFAVSNG